MKKTTIEKRYQKETDIHKAYALKLTHDIEKAMGKRKVKKNASTNN